MVKQKSSHFYIPVVRAFVERAAVSLRAPVALAGPVIKQQRDKLAVVAAKSDAKALVQCFIPAQFLLALSIAFSASAVSSFRSPVIIETLKSFCAVTMAIEY